MANRRSITPPAAYAPPPVSSHVAGNPPSTSPLSQSLQSNPPSRSGRFLEDFDASQRGHSLLIDSDDAALQLASTASTLNQGAAPSRSGTLKKKSSIRRSASLKRSGSRRSLHAGSIRGVSTEDDDDGAPRQSSVFFTPIPTTGAPTAILVQRFQAWRKFLKDLVTYFREMAAFSDHRSKSLLKVSNVVNNLESPSAFLAEGGINDATRILRDFHRHSVLEANKAREIHVGIINKLIALRADLALKIKEIKELAGDFKNSIDKEKETTRKVVAALNEALSMVDSDPAAIAGKSDPYVLRLAVDRQVEKQIDEENYLHRAYLNLESSGRELESAVVLQVQKAYQAMMACLKHEADETYATLDRLRQGPISMPCDLEWNHMVSTDPNLVSPNVQLRRLPDIEYPGKHHPATVEVRAGMLERKSKYLKSYSAGWFVLSPTHIHEFKSADRIHVQPPLMSLYLPDQKLGSHSQPSSSSHKFVLKGRQTGTMHRGHNWVFRAESYDTMLAWYDDIKNLTEKKGEDRDAFVRKHSRNWSNGTMRSISSDGGLEEDEADQVPYSANHSFAHNPTSEAPPPRPSPGGRFPSDIPLEHNLQAPLPPSSGSSDNGIDLTTAAGGRDGSYFGPNQPAPETQAGYAPSHNLAPSRSLQESPTAQGTLGPATAPAVHITSGPAQTDEAVQTGQPASTQPPPAAALLPLRSGMYDPPEQPGISRHDSTYGEWMAPVVARGAAGEGPASATPAPEHPHEQHTSLPESHYTPSDEAKPAAVDQMGASKPVSSEPADPTPASLLSAEAPHVTRPPNVRNDGSVNDLHVPGEYPRMARG